MGAWAKAQFGAEQLSSVGIVIASTNTPEFERNILGLFDAVLFSKDTVYHTHRVRLSGKEYAVVFNVYGAPAMVDVLTEMFDGDVRTVIFVGYAYGGFKDLGVGSIVVPNKCYHYHGMYHRIDEKRHEDIPDRQARDMLAMVLRQSGIAFHVGSNISVPAVTLQPPHANEAYTLIDPLTLELELAACIGRANDIGVRAAGVLIISDNKHSSIGAEEKKYAKQNSKSIVLHTIIHNMHVFDLAPLPSRNFSVNEYLASIVADPRDSTNVYRK